PARRRRLPAECHTCRCPSARACGCSAIRKPGRNGAPARQASASGGSAASSARVAPPRRSCVSRTRHVRPRPPRGEHKPAPIPGSSRSATACGKATRCRPLLASWPCSAAADLSRSSPVLVGRRRKTLQADEFAGVHDVGGIERALHSAHQLDLYGGFVMADLVALEAADAVLGADRPLKLFDDAVDDIVELLPPSEIGPGVGALRLGPVEVDVAIPDMPESERPGAG